MMDQDPFSLAGKRILVTGASSGIGRQVALSCADMGAQLIITGRDPQRLQATADELPGSGHLAVIADLAQPVDLARLVEQTGVINGLVHAAGISRLVPFRMISQAHLSEMFEHNTYAPMMLTKELLGKKRVVAGGSIVFISALSLIHI